MQTPDEWLADFEAKVADLQQKATEFKTTVEAAGTTESSADGAVTVTVAPNGSLTGLHLADAAMGKTAADLAAEILALSRRARQAAAAGVAEAFVPLGGDRDVVQHIPGAEADEEQPPAAPPRRAESTVDEEEEFETVVLYEDESKW
ncbi:YbaB/EbfC family nucleoid-associated protein [Actinokineospora sp.]|uniref:YbaB/EbfC family nucleoid-associated protein n=1 Tax=Actinokineospora sp. TaxID=1872133 RepID=UPI0040377794